MRWVFFALGLCSLSFAAPRLYPVHRPDEVKLRIELVPKSTVIRVGERPEFAAKLINDGSEPITVVRPGDGSHSARRTPVLRWNPPMELRPGCGCISALRSDEVVTLAAGESMPFSVTRLELTMVGKHAMSLELENIPGKEWAGIHGPHDAEALARVRRTLPFTARSNVVEIEVLP